MVHKYSAKKKEKYFTYGRQQDSTISKDMPTIAEGGDEASSSSDQSNNSVIAQIFKSEKN